MVVKEVVLMKTFQSYSGCSLKYLGLWTPNGLALLMLGPFEGIVRIYAENSFIFMSLCVFLFNGV